MVGERGQGLGTSEVDEMNRVGSHLCMWLVSEHEQKDQGSELYIKCFKVALTHRLVVGPLV